MTMLPGGPPTGSLSMERPPYSGTASSPGWACGPARRSAGSLSCRPRAGRKTHLVEQVRKQAVVVIDRIKLSESSVSKAPGRLLTVADLAERYMEVHVPRRASTGTRPVPSRSTSPVTTLCCDLRNTPRTLGPVRDVLSCRGPGLVPPDNNPCQCVRRQMEGKRERFLMKDAFRQIGRALHPGSLEAAASELRLSDTRKGACTVALPPTAHAVPAGDRPRFAESLGVPRKNAGPPPVRVHDLLARRPTSVCPRTPRRTRWPRWAAPSRPTSLRAKTAVGVDGSSIGRGRIENGPREMRHGDGAAERAVEPVPRRAVRRGQGHHLPGSQRFRGAGLPVGGEGLSGAGSGFRRIEAGNTSAGMA